MGGDRGGHLRHLRRHSCHGRQSHRMHGAARLPGMEVEIEGRHPDRVRSGMSGAARQFHGDAALSAPPGGGPRADDSARRGAASDLAVRQTRPRRRATAAATTSRPSLPRNTDPAHCIVKLGCWGPVVQCNVGKRGWMGGNRRLPECRRNLHRLHDARISGQVHAVHESAAGVAALLERGDDVRPGDSCAAPVHPGIAEQRAELAKPAQVSPWLATR